MPNPLRVLIVEDSKLDAELIQREIATDTGAPTCEVVDTLAAMRQALEQRTWDVVICDYSMPQFSAPAALAFCHGLGLDLPFIVVSGTVGEELAVEMMKAGAHDYVMKDRLARLGPAIERELRAAQERQERQRQEQERLRLIGELTEALAHVKTLSGLLPICSWCKKIRDDHGYWQQVEVYLRQHSEADFTHGICPDCQKRMGQAPRSRDRANGQSPAPDSDGESPRQLHLREPERRALTLREPETREAGA